MFRPLRNQILVRPIEKRQSALLEVVSGDKPAMGEIVSVGPKACDVAPGDIIHFGTTENYLSFPSYEENGERLLVLSEADVCFVEDRAA